MLLSGETHNQIDVRRTMAASNNEEKIHLAIENDSGILELLIKYKININSRGLPHGRSFLHTAVLNDKYDVAKLLLQEFKADAKLRAKDGATPLHVAVQQDSLRMVCLLLKHKAYPNDKWIGLTPLHIALKNNNAPIVKTLILHGARIKKAAGKDNSTEIRSRIRQLLLEEEEKEKRVRDKHPELPKNIGKPKTSHKNKEVPLRIYLLKKKTFEEFNRLMSELD